MSVPALSGIGKSAAGLRKFIAGEAISKGDFLVHRGTTPDSRKVKKMNNPTALTDLINQVSGLTLSATLSANAITASSNNSLIENTAIRRNNYFNAKLTDGRTIFFLFTSGASQGVKYFNTDGSMSANFALGFTVLGTVDAYKVEALAAGKAIVALGSKYNETKLVAADGTVSTVNFVAGIFSGKTPPIYPPFFNHVGNDDILAMWNDGTLFKIKADGTLPVSIGVVASANNTGRHHTLLQVLSDGSMLVLTCPLTGYATPHLTRISSSFALTYTNQNIEFLTTTRTVHYTDASHDDIALNYKNKSIIANGRLIFLIEGTTSRLWSISTTAPASDKFEIAAPVVDSEINGIFSMGSSEYGVFYTTALDTVAAKLTLVVDVRATSDNSLLRTYTFPSQFWRTNLLSTIPLNIDEVKYNASRNSFTVVMSGDFYFVAPTSRNAMGKIINIPLDGSPNLSEYIIYQQSLTGSYITNVGPFVVYANDDVAYVAGDGLNSGTSGSARVTSLTPRMVTIPTFVTPVGIAQHSAAINEPVIARVMGSEVLPAGFSLSTTITVSGSEGFYAGGLGHGGTSMTTYPQDGMIELKGFVV